MTAIGMAPAGPPMPLNCGRPLQMLPGEEERYNQLVGERARMRADHAAGQRLTALADERHRGTAQSEIDEAETLQQAMALAAEAIKEGRTTWQHLDLREAWQRFTQSGAAPATHRLVRLTVDVFSRGLGAPRLKVRLVEEVGVDLWDASDPNATVRDEHVGVHVFKKMTSKSDLHDCDRSNYVRVYLEADGATAFAVTRSDSYFEDPNSRQRTNVRFRCDGQELLYAVPAGQHLEPRKRGDAQTWNKQERQRKRGEIVRDGLGIPVDQIKRVVELTKVGREDLNRMQMFSLLRATERS